MFTIVNRMAIALQLLKTPIFSRDPPLKGWTHEKMESENDTVIFKSRAALRRRAPTPSRGGLPLLHRRGEQLPCSLAILPGCKATPTGVVYYYLFQLNISNYPGPLGQG
jgi:hypothetical protein